MASENEASCESDPNFAVICGFLEKFGVSCGLTNIDFLDLQEMLENTQEVSQDLVELHIKLLRKARKSVSNERWERALINLCHSYCSQDAWELERFGYKKARIGSKLRILKQLLEIQFDFNQKFKNEINKMSAEELRSQPLGKDRMGRAYWCQCDESCQIRVYKDDPDEETWTLVAKDRDGLVSLISQLGGTTDSAKSSSEPVSNEDSNSVEVGKPILDTGQESTENLSSTPLKEQEDEDTLAEDVLKHTLIEDVDQIIKDVKETDKDVKETDKDVKETEDGNYATKNIKDPANVEESKKDDVEEIEKSFVPVTEAEIVEKPEKEIVKETKKDAVAETEKQVVAESEKLVAETEKQVVAEIEKHIVLDTEKQVVTETKKVEPVKEIVTQKAEKLREESSESEESEEDEEEEASGEEEEEDGVEEEDAEEEEEEGDVDEEEDVEEEQEENEEQLESEKEVTTSNGSEKIDEFNDDNILNLSSKDGKVDDDEQFDSESNEGLDLTVKSATILRLKPLMELMPQPLEHERKDFVGIKGKYIRGDVNEKVTYTNPSILQGKAVQSASFDAISYKRQLEEDDYEEPTHPKLARFDRPTLLGNKKLQQSYFDEDVEEEIEEPIMLVQGKGSGYDNECVNSKEESPIVGETIEESVMFVFGEGHGADCETGNGESSKSEKNTSKYVNESESRKESSGTQEHSFTSPMKVHYKLGTIIDSKTDKIINKSPRRRSRWDVGKPIEKTDIPPAASVSISNISSSIVKENISESQIPVEKLDESTLEDSNTKQSFFFGSPSRSAFVTNSASLSFGSMKVSSPDKNVIDISDTKITEDTNLKNISQNIQTDDDVKIRQLKHISKVPEDVDIEKIDNNILRDTNLVESQEISTNVGSLNDDIDNCDRPVVTQVGTLQESMVSVNDVSVAQSKNVCDDGKKMNEVLRTEILTQCDANKEIVNDESKSEVFQNCEEIDSSNLLQELVKPVNETEDSIPIENKQEPIVANSSLDDENIEGEKIFPKESDAKDTKRLEEEITLPREENQEFEKHTEIVENAETENNKKEEIIEKELKTESFVITETDILAESGKSDEMDQNTSNAAISIVAIEQIDVKEASEIELAEGPETAKLCEQAEQGSYHGKAVNEITTDILPIGTVNERSINKVSQDEADAINESVNTDEKIESKIESHNSTEFAKNSIDAIIEPQNDEDCRKEINNLETSNLDARQNEREQSENLEKQLNELVDVPKSKESENNDSSSEQHEKLVEGQQEDESARLNTDKEQLNSATTTQESLTQFEIDSPSSASEINDDSKMESSKAQTEAVVKNQNDVITDSSVAKETTAPDNEILCETTLHSDEQNDDKIEASSDDESENKHNSCKNAQLNELNDEKTKLFKNQEHEGLENPIKIDEIGKPDVEQDQVKVILEHEEIISDSLDDLKNKKHSNVMLEDSCGTLEEIDGIKLHIRGAQDSLLDNDCNVNDDANVLDVKSVTESNICDTNVNISNKSVLKEEINEAPELVSSIKHSEVFHNDSHKSTDISKSEDSSGLITETGLEITKSPDDPEIMNVMETTEESGKSNGNNLINTAESDTADGPNLTLQELKIDNEEHQVELNEEISGKERNEGNRQYLDELSNIANPLPKDSSSSDVQTDFANSRTVEITQEPHREPQSKNMQEVNSNIQVTECKNKYDCVAETTKIEHETNNEELRLQRKGTLESKSDIKTTDSVKDDDCANAIEENVEIENTEVQDHCKHKSGEIPNKELSSNTLNDQDKKISINSVKDDDTSHEVMCDEPEQGIADKAPDSLQDSPTYNLDLNKSDKHIDNTPNLQCEGDDVVPNVESQELIENKLNILIKEVSVNQDNEMGSGNRLDDDKISIDSTVTGLRNCEINLPISEIKHHVTSPETDKKLAEIESPDVLKSTKFDVSELIEENKSTSEKKEPTTVSNDTLKPAEDICDNSETKNQEISMSSESTKIIENAIDQIDNKDENMEITNELENNVTDCCIDDKVQNKDTLILTENIPQSDVNAKKSVVNELNEISEGSTPVEDKVIENSENLVKHDIGQEAISNNQEEIKSNLELSKSVEANVSCFKDDIEHNPPEESHSGKSVVQSNFEVIPEKPTEVSTSPQSKELVEIDELPKSSTAQLEIKEKKNYVKSRSKRATKHKTKVVDKTHNSDLTKTDVECKTDSLKSLDDCKVECVKNDSISSKKTKLVKGLAQTKLDQKSSENIDKPKSANNLNKVKIESKSQMTTRQSKRVLNAAVQRNEDDKLEVKSKVKSQKKEIAESKEKDVVTKSTQKVISKAEKRRGSTTHKSKNKELVDNKIVIKEEPGLIEVGKKKWNKNLRENKNVKDIQFNKTKNQIETLVIEDSDSNFSMGGHQNATENVIVLEDDSKDSEINRPIKIEKDLDLELEKKLNKGMNVMVKLERYTAPIPKLEFPEQRVTRSLRERKGRQLAPLQPVASIQTFSSAQPLSPVQPLPTNQPFAKKYKNMELSKDLKANTSNEDSLLKIASIEIIKNTVYKEKPRKKSKYEAINPVRRSSRRIAGDNDDVMQEEIVVKKKMGRPRLFGNKCTKTTRELSELKKGALLTDELELRHSKRLRLSDSQKLNPVNLAVLKFGNYKNKKPLDDVETIDLTSENETKSSSPPPLFPHNSPNFPQNDDTSHSYCSPPSHNHSPYSDNPFIDDPQMYDPPSHSLPFNHNTHDPHSNSITHNHSPPITRRMSTRNSKQNKFQETDCKDGIIIEGVLIKGDVTIKIKEKTPVEEPRCVAKNVPLLTCVDIEKLKEPPSNKIISNYKAMEAKSSVSSPLSVESSGGDLDNNSDVVIVEDDPLACSGLEYGEIEMPLIKPPLTLNAFKLDGLDSPIPTIRQIPSITTRSLRKRNRTDIEEPERVLEECGAKRRRIKGKRQIDLELRKSIEEQKKQVISSSEDDDAKNNVQLPKFSPRKKPPSPNKLLINKSPILTGSPLTTTDDTIAPVELEEISEDFGGKRRKTKSKPQLDLELRKSIDEEKKLVISSSDDDTKNDVELPTLSPQNTPHSPTKLVINKNTISDNTYSPLPSDVPSEVSKDDPVPVVKVRTRKRKKKTLMGLDICPEIQEALNDCTSNVRQSRRIAQLKIREEAERRKLEEIQENSKEKKRKGKKNIDKDYKAEKRKKSIHITTDDELVAVDVPEPEEKKKKKKKKRKHKDPRKIFDESNPWRSSSDSSSSNDDVEEEEEIAEFSEAESPLFKSDHEFSPESDLEGTDEVQPLRRARTAKKENDVEEDVDDHACQKCSKTDHPEWILLCDGCDNGWHCSCLRPALLVIPEGDWYCPPCQHNILLKKLEEKLVEYDKKMVRREVEVRRKERLAYVGISLANVLPIKDFDEQKRKKQKGNEQSESEESASSSSSSSSSSSESDSDEPIYQLRQRRQAHSYRFNDYDDLINSAIQDEMEIKGAGNQGRGKDILTIVNAEKEEEAKRQSDKQEVEPLPPVVPVESKELPSAVVPSNPDDSDDEEIRPVKKFFGRKKHRKLNCLDVSSGDDQESDEDFKGSSSGDDEEEYDDVGSDSSENYGRRKKDGPVRRSTRARVSRYDKEFLNDTSGDDDAPRKKRTKSAWDESESEESDRSWGRVGKRKPQPRRPTFPKKKKKKSKKKNSDSDDERYKKKKPRIKYGGLTDDDEDEEIGRRTRGKKINYIDALASDSEEEVRKRAPPRIESDDDYDANDDPDLPEDDDEDAEEKRVDDAEKSQDINKDVNHLEGPVSSETSTVANQLEIVEKEVPLDKETLQRMHDLELLNSSLEEAAEELQSLPDFEDDESELNPIDEMNKNLEQMNEKEMEMMMEEEEYANRQLHIMALQLEKERKRKEREAKRMERLMNQEHRVPKKRGRKPKAALLLPEAIHNKNIVQIATLQVGPDMQSNPELSEPPGVSIPIFSDMQSGSVSLDSSGRKRRGRGKGKKTLEKEAAAAAAFGPKDSMDSSNSEHMQSASNSDSMASNSPMHGGKLTIAAPPQPFSQTQPTPSVITRMLQSQSGQGNFPINMGHKYFAGDHPLPHSEAHAGPPTSGSPILGPSVQGPPPSLPQQFMHGGPHMIPQPYRQPPPGINPYPLPRSSPGSVNRLRTPNHQGMPPGTQGMVPGPQGISGQQGMPPGPQGMPPGQQAMLPVQQGMSQMYHTHLALDPSPSGGGSINIPNVPVNLADPHSPPPTSESPLSNKSDQTPPPPPYNRPQMQRFPPGHNSPHLGASPIRHLLPPQHMQQPRTNMPYHPGMPPNYFSGYMPPNIGTEESLPPTNYQYNEQFSDGNSPQNMGKAYDEENSGEFGGLVSYFSSQREDDLDT